VRNIVYHYVWVDIKNPGDQRSAFALAQPTWNGPAFGLVAA